MRRILVVAVAVILMAAPVRAAPPGPFALISEHGPENGAADGPLWCGHEDWQHERVWVGSLRGAFGTTERLCTTEEAPAGPGGVGLRIYATVKGREPVSLTATSPTGVIWAAQPVLTDANTRHHLLCVLTPVPWTQTLEPGTWTLSFVADTQYATLTLDASMAYWRSGCP